MTTTAPAECDPTPRGGPSPPPGTGSGALAPWTRPRMLAAARGEVVVLSWRGRGHLPGADDLGGGGGTDGVGGRDDYRFTPAIPRSINGNRRLSPLSSDLGVQVGGSSLSPQPHRRHPDAVGRVSATRRTRLALVSGQLDISDCFQVSPPLLLFLFSPVLQPRPFLLWDHVFTAWRSGWGVLQKGTFRGLTQKTKSFFFSYSGFGIIGGGGGFIQRARKQFSVFTSLFSFFFPD